MKKIALFALFIFFISTLAACNISNLIVPETVTINGTIYRNGFYGDLWPEDLTYNSDAYMVGDKEFYHVDNDQFDWVHSSIGDTTSGVLYCAESQWEQAYEYYHDNYANIAAIYENERRIQVAGNNKYMLLPA